MLEAKDYQALDMYFSFIGAYIDRCCGEVKSSPTKRIFTQYSELVMLVYRRRMKVGLTEEHLKELSGRIIRFKSDAVELYEPYQPSGMGTLKFHHLDHVVDDIRNMGGIESLDAGLYEHSHTKGKRCYSRTSKRRTTAMAESMEVLHRMQAYEKEGTENRRHGRELGGNVELVRDGQNMSLNDIVMARRRIRRNRKDKTDCTLPSTDAESNAGQLVWDIGEDGARVLTMLLKNR